MTDDRVESFAEFWLFYVRQHSRAATRRIHVLGTTLALLFLGAALLLGQWRWLLLVPLSGYGLAWLSHFFIEENRPATFKHPLWALRGDLKMWALTFTGQMAEEVRRSVAIDESQPWHPPAATDGE